MGGLFAVYGSEELGYEGAGPLGVVFAAFVSNYFWCREGWEIEDNPVGTGFEIFWMFFEPLLFGITGTSPSKVHDSAQNMCIYCVTFIYQFAGFRLFACLRALSVFTGASIKIRELDSNIVTIGVSILVVTGIVRIIVTILIAFGDNFNIKERVSHQ